MAGSPRIRRSIAKALLSAVERLPAMERSEVLDAVPPQTLQNLREGLGLSWISGYEYHVLPNALLRTLQAERFRTLYTDLYMSVSQQPILAAITQTAMRMGLGTPLGLARYTAPAWQHVAEDMGRFELLTDPSGACLRCTGYPTDLGPPGVFVQAFAGTFDGFYALCGRSDRVEIRDVDPANGCASFWLHD